jgi:hypothetical protein
MVMRAVHLEVVDTMSAAGFLNALRTFCNIRGQPQMIYTDNGTNFVGAERRIREDLLLKGIRWKFQPPLAPHWGGVHEALVKSAKMALHSTIEKAQLRRYFTESEFRCLLAEVMGFLNGRPLVYQRNGVEDGVSITPNHFLLQRPGMEIPDSNYKASKLGDTFDFVQHTADEVWKLWQDEYLPTLLERAKWRFRDRDLQLGDTVLVVDNNLPRNMWSVGWIKKVFKGENSCVRSAVVKTPKGEYERPITRLCVLEEADPEDPWVKARVQELELVPGAQELTGGQCSTENSAN